jgi:hypothetical protein
MAPIKNKRGACGQHVELHHGVHASYLHQGYSVLKFSRKRQAKEAQRLLHRRINYAEHTYKENFVDIMTFENCSMIRTSGHRLFEKIALQEYFGATIDSI